MCWHTYPMPGGRGWQFRYDPNIIKQIEERKDDISIEDGRSRVLAEAQEYFAAKDRPMLQLTLTASTPAAGAALAGLAQPLGADSLTLSVSVGGPLKDSGTMTFSAGEVNRTIP